MLASSHPNASLAPDCGLARLYLLAREAPARIIPLDRIPLVLIIGYRVSVLD